MLLEFEDLSELLSFNIKYYRYLKNISQQELSRMCNFNSRYITYVENGSHCPTIDKIELIANSLEVEPYVLFMNIKRDEIIVSKIYSTRQYNQRVKETV